MASFIDDVRYGFLRRHGVIAQIIVICVSVFLVFTLLSLLSWLGGIGVLDNLVYRYLGLPSQLGELLQRPWTPLTYMFVHDFSGIFHLLFNMLWLWGIGRILREYQGDNRVWISFIGGGLVGGLVFLVSFNLIPALSGFGSIPLVGASAGVMAVVVATATLLPDFQIGLLFFGPVRLKWIALIMIVLDLIMIPRGNPGGMLAHLGGSLFGFLYIRSLQSGTGWNPMARVFDPSRNLRVVRSSVAATGPTRTSASPRAKVGTPTEDEVNRILDKIKAVGYDRLSKEEKQTLFHASQGQ